jgi:DNA repair exonuclease SbcCD ATPase subunit
MNKPTKDNEIIGQQPNNQTDIPIKPDLNDKPDSEEKPNQKPSEESKPTYEELVKKVTQLETTLKNTRELSRRKEEAWDREREQFKDRIKKLKEDLEKKPTPVAPVEEIYTYGETPFNKLTALLEKNFSKEVLKKELGDLYGKFHQPNQFSASWQNTFKGKTPIEIKKDFEEKERGYLDRIKQLEGLLRNRRTSTSTIINKRETKLCEICNQIKQDRFKYSRVSATGFNTYHVYRICSYCQKIVQTVDNNRQNLI